MDRTELQAEALRRAKDDRSHANYQTILEGLEARGIPSALIVPRETVFTFNAWGAKGRKVRKRPACVPKGQWAVRVTTLVPTSEKDENGKQALRPKPAFVFHEWQTVADGSKAHENPDAEAWYQAFLTESRASFADDPVPEPDPIPNPKPEAGAMPPGYSEAS